MTMLATDQERHEQVGRGACACAAVRCRVCRMTTAMIGWLSWGMYK